MNDAARPFQLSTIAALLLAASHATSAAADELAAPPLVVSLAPGSGGAPWKLRVH